MDQAQIELLEHARKLFHKAKTNPDGIEAIYEGAASYPTVDIPSEVQEVETIVNSNTGEALSKKEAAAIKSAISTLELLIAQRDAAHEKNRADHLIYVQKKMSERLKELELQLESTREAAVARNAVSNAAAQGSPSTFSTTPTAEQMCIGVKADNIDVHYDPTTRPKESDISKIKSESKEGDLTELKRSAEGLFDLVYSNSSGQQEALNALFEIADRGLGGGTAMGSVRFGQSLKNGDIPFCVGPNPGSTKRLDTGSIGSSSLAAQSGSDQDDSLNDPRERQVYTESEIALAWKDAMDSIFSGSDPSLPPSIFNAATGIRTYILNGAMILFGLKRGTAQHRAALALLAVIEDFIRSNSGAPYIDDLKAIHTKYMNVLRWPDHAVERDAMEISPTLCLFAMSETNQFIVNNILSEIRKAVERRDYGDVIAELGAAFVEVKMDPNESSVGYHQRLLSLGRSCRPRQNINYSALGIGVSNGTFDIFKPNNVACLVIIATNEHIKEQPTAIRDCLSKEMFKKALNGDATEEDLQVLLANLKAADYQVKPENKGGRGTGKSLSFFSAANDRSGTSAGVKANQNPSRKDSDGKGKGKGKGDGKGSDDGRGRSLVKNKAAARDRSLSAAEPGERKAWEHYRSGREVLGDGFENLAAVAAEITQYCISIGKPDCFRRHNKSGDLMIPLQLTQGYHWVANPESLNYNFRRDFYALMQLLRDISTGGTASNKHSQFSKPGWDYMKNTGVTDWKVLSPAQFKAAYRPSATSVPIRTTPVTIHGANVREFKA